jgi:acylphosphatase
MRTYNQLRRQWLYAAAALMSCILAMVALARDAKAQNVTAVSGVVTGNVQQVGFRAMIQKQAIEYNLAGSAQNNSDKSVRFVLQGASDRIDEVLAAIRKGTKKSSDVKVSTSPASVDSSLKTFTVVGWTSLSRGISHPYDLVFDLRPDDTTIKKGDAKKVWLGICETTVKGDDVGKCDKDKDDD